MQQSLDTSIQVRRELARLKASATLHKGSKETKAIGVCSQTPRVHVLLLTMPQSLGTFLQVTREKGRLEASTTLHKTKQEIKSKSSYDRRVSELSFRQPAALCVKTTSRLVPIDLACVGEQPYLAKPGRKWDI